MAKARRLEGIYMLLNKGEVVYVGESNDLLKRIGDHIRENTKEFDSFYVYETADRRRMEGYLQKILRPKYNITDNSWYGFGKAQELYTKCMTLEDICASYSAKAISVKLVAEDLEPYCYSEQEIYDTICRHSDEVPSWIHFYDDRGESMSNWEIDWGWYHENKERFRDWVLNQC